MDIEQINKANELIQTVGVSIEMQKEVLQGLVLSLNEYAIFIQQELAKHIEKTEA